MDAEEFRRCGKQLIDFMADYVSNIRDYQVIPKVCPGYLRCFVPEEAPAEGECWDDIFKDIERVILPGMVHWSSPRFHSYLPTGNSFPSVCGEMLSAIFGCIGFSWSSCPASTDLEMAMLDWLGKMVNLPDEFLFSSNGKGGGAILSSASESTLVALLSARNKAITTVQATTIWSRGTIMNKLVYYTSTEAHSSVERAGLLGGVVCRLIPTDSSSSLRSDVLQATIDKDRSEGNIPFLVVGTLGTTSVCAFDNIMELGELCRKEDLWLHIDASYAGAAFICPEFRYLLKGIEYVDSFLLCPGKWMLINYDCCAMWVRNREEIVKPFVSLPST
ncbi:aromatic-L-amino-acid decarboxylase-like [Tachypleus tridentatus]|uniref:aromatic-L-amino-acid decarboxylase-like n=1 Tax=Tachypleus tridentatus TaxID=6853 RepID=UPI003FD25D01